MRRSLPIAVASLAITIAFVITAASRAQEEVSAAPPVPTDAAKFEPQGHDFSQFGSFRTMPQGADSAVPPWVHDGEVPRQAIYERFGFYHSNPDDPARHQGVGRPLYGTSWRNRPYHFDYLFGVVETNDLERNEIQLRSTLLQGIRLGYDFDHYWGTEIRFAYGDGKVRYDANPLIDGSAQLMMFDTNLLYYPWGDSVWRPYATIGLGATYYGYDDVNGVNRDQSNFSIPIGIGLKHFFRPWLAFRCELMDNIATGSGSVPTTHNFSFTTGVEYRFGGSHWSYTR
ncbi:porin family protein [Blastopirellula sp. JC732]|uniref:Porin family protein n=1 Tax=Blastopirellula sediminis TaxID=2894196 RepID=A0A9X1ML41_9BACT|nr:porin family protein [Blastopirellula sediminis]MCC9607539.1 porin family protein [Blastopirellula sediminis]MCC9629168.1 porin family protein [Blastopirellula sediminis]